MSTTASRRSRPQPKQPAAPKPPVSADDGSHNQQGSEAVAEPGPDTQETGKMQATRAPGPVIWKDPVENIIGDLRREFVAGLAEIAASDTPYHELQNALRAQGWFLHLREMRAEPHTGGGTLICFEVVVGWDAGLTTTVDRITLVAPANVVDVSSWARLNSYTAVNFAVFGQLPPPKAEPQPEFERPAATAAAADTQQAARTGDWEPLDLVAERSPDGLPLYYDPFALGEAPEDIIDSALISLRNEIPEISGLENLSALWTENVTLFEFMREMQPAALTEATDLLNKRRDELTALVPTPAARPRAGRVPATKR